MNKSVLLTSTYVCIQETVNSQGNVPTFTILFHKLINHNMTNEFNV